MSEDRRLTVGVSHIELIEIMRSAFQKDPSLVSGTTVYTMSKEPIPGFLTVGIDIHNYPGLDEAVIQKLCDLCATEVVQHEKKAVIVTARAFGVGELHLFVTVSVRKDASVLTISTVSH